MTSISHRFGKALALYLGANTAYGLAQTQTCINHVTLDSWSEFHVWISDRQQFPATSLLEGELNTWRVFWCTVKYNFFSDVLWSAYVTGVTKRSGGEDSMETPYRHQRRLYKVSWKIDDEETPHTKSPMGEEIRSVSKPFHNVTTMGYFAEQVRTGVVYPQDLKQMLPNMRKSVERHFKLDQGIEVALKYRRGFKASDPFLAIFRGLSSRCEEV